jgi:hypothetical protein
LKQLRKLHLVLRVRLSAKALQQLKAALPDCEINGPPPGRP